jgi:hypothetical protein
MQRLGCIRMRPPPPLKREKAVGRSPAGGGASASRQQKVPRLMELVAWLGEEHAIHPLELQELVKKGVLRVEGATRNLSYSLAAG